MSKPTCLIAIAAMVLFGSHCVSAQKREKITEHENGYLQESPHPKGFPNPGPFNQVITKSYPAYRAATTKTEGPNRGFWTLFRHIKSKDIAMTSPVEMKMAEGNDGSLEMQEMLFLYRHAQQGEAGPDGSKVQVKNLPEMKVLSYAWQGPNNQQSIAKAKARLLEEAKSQQLKFSSFRLLGYNSPFIPNNKKTHELQLILE